MASDLLDVTLDSSADYAGGRPDPLMLFFKTSPIPRNSGAQTVVPKIIKLRNRAKRLRPPLKQHILDMAKEYLYAYASIGGEAGFYIRELNTNRIAQNNMMSTNVGPPVNALDEWFNGKMPNNPQSKGMGLEMDMK